MPLTNDRHGHPIEIVIGRSVAICVHPVAVWHSSSMNDRAVLLASYFTVGYAIALALLHALSL